MISSRRVFMLSGILTVLITACSLWGILTPDFYSRETRNWQAQSIGQDKVDLMVIVPVLLVTSILCAGSSKGIGVLLWAGVLLYLIYTFTIYCFAIHFNVLFLVYCITLGVSFYSFLYVLYNAIKYNSMPVVHNSIQLRVIGIYFIVISVLFYALWLSDIIPSIQSGNTSENLIESGLFTNPVHIIDLAIFLPGLFISGVLVLKRMALGFLFIPVILVFFILMDITIGVLVVIMKQRGLNADLSVAYAMSVLVLFSLGILVMFIRTVFSEMMKNNKSSV